MTVSLSRKLSVFSDGSILEQPVTTSDRKLRRVLHDVEMVLGNWREPMPEVFRLEPDHHVILTEPLQWLWRRMNPTMSDKRFCSLFNNDLAFTNRTGFPGRHNYILNEDVEEKDPAFDQARICGGAVVSERYEEGGKVYIESIDVRKPLPTVEYIMARPWLYFDAVLSGNTIRRFPQADGERVYVPLLTAVDNVWLPAVSLQKWTAAEMPDPYRIYL